MDHEKVLREGLEADLAALLEEMAQLKLNTISQVREWVGVALVVQSGAYRLCYMLGAWPRLDVAAMPLTPVIDPWGTLQVEFLRVYMNEEITSLLHHVTSRDTLIATLRAWLRRTQQVAADHMARLRHRRVLLAWRCGHDHRT